MINNYTWGSESELAPISIIESGYDQVINLILKFCARSVSQCGIKFQHEVLMKKEPRCSNFDTHCFLVPTVFSPKWPSRTTNTWPIITKRISATCQHLHQPFPALQCCGRPSFCQMIFHFSLAKRNRDFSHHNYKKTLQFTTHFDQ